VDRRQVFSTIVTMANTHQIFPRCRCVQCPNESLVSWKERRNRRYINVSLAFFHARWWHHERDQIGAFIINCCAILKQKILVEHQHHIRTTTMQEKMRFFCVLQTHHSSRRTLKMNSNYCSRFLATFSPTYQYLKRNNSCQCFFPFILPCYYYILRPPPY